MKYPINFKKIAGLVVAAVMLFAAFRTSDKPVVYLIGDSTVRNSETNKRGWGSWLDNFLDTSKVSIKNQAMAGRSTRTFVKEGRWAKVDSMLKPGDYVFMQFGHNEGSVPDTNKAGYRGVLRGTGEDTKELTWPDGKKETVLTYGAYLRRFIRGTKAKGAIPVVLSMIPRNQWKDGKVIRADSNYGKWAREVAEQEGAFFIDLNHITADKYDKLGAEKVKAFFPGDHTHPSEEGARVNAESVAEGIKQLNELKLKKFLL